MIEPVEHDRGLVAAHDAIRPGAERPALGEVEVAERFRVLALPDMFRQHHKPRGLAGGERVFRPARARLLQLDLHGAGVSGGNTLDPFADGAAERHFRRTVAQRFEGENDIVGGQRLAVGPADVGAKRDGYLAIVGRGFHPFRLPRDHRVGEMVGVE